jgi:hypothetical protein
MAKRSHKQKKRVGSVSHAIAQASLLSKDGVAVAVTEPKNIWGESQRVLGRLGGEIKYDHLRAEWIKIRTLAPCVLKTLAKLEWKPNAPAAPLELLAKVGK